MAVVLVFFNPTGSVRLVSNYLYVWNLLMAANIPVFGIELCFPWQRRPAIAEGFKTLTVRSTSVMFHKEKLQQRLLQEIPAETYPKVMSLDCDIVFNRPDWYDAVSAALDAHPVIQPWERCQRLGPNFQPVDDIQISLGRLLSEGYEFGSILGHTGYSLAWRRAELEPFPYCITGGGDSYVMDGLYGRRGSIVNVRTRDLIEPAHAAWRDAQSARGQGIMAVACNIFHLWHGSDMRRRYRTRHELFAESVPGDVTDMRTLLEENADGMWEWRAPYRSALNNMMLRYFSDRDDDSV